MYGNLHILVQLGGQEMENKGSIELYLCLIIIGCVIFIVSLAIASCICPEGNSICVAHCHWRYYVVIPFLALIGLWSLNLVFLMIVIAEVEKWKIKV